MRRTRRCASTTANGELTRWGGIPISTRRAIVCDALLVCNVENTRWPVSALSIAIFAVSASRISPIRISGSIHLAHELGLLVVVEGVETAEELAIIKSRGCRLIQGFYFSEPLPIAAMTTLLRTGTIVPGLPS